MTFAHTLSSVNSCNLSEFRLPEFIENYRKPGVFIIVLSDYKPSNTFIQIPVPSCTTIWDSQILSHFGINVDMSSSNIFVTDHNSRPKSKFPSQFEANRW